MSDYSEFFLTTRSNVVQLELMELSHPDFTATYRIVRNHADGVTVNLSDTEQNVPFSYYPARMSALGARDDLDAAIKVELGDLGEVVPQEIDAVSEAGGFLTKPQVRYWTFRSDRLDAPIYGPLHLEVPSFSFNRQGATFEARAPSLNVIRTGERYRVDRFSSLNGFL